MYEVRWETDKPRIDLITRYSKPDGEGITIEQTVESGDAPEGEGAEDMDLPRSFDFDGSCCAFFE